MAHLSLQNFLIILQAQTFARLSPQDKDFSLVVDVIPRNNNILSFLKQSNISNYVSWAKKFQSKNFFSLKK